MVRFGFSVGRPQARAHDLGVPYQHVPSYLAGASIPAAAANGVVEVSEGTGVVESATYGCRMV